MNKIRIIDLLNKIANGEEVPKEIMYDNQDFYWCEPCKIYERFGDAKDLYNLLDNLNDEVEIIEEEHKIPEKLSEYADIYADIITKWSCNEEKLKNKINEIIDYLKENK